ncbi:MAG: hypothetical protein JW938_02320 [Candidatus Omnitrophica bacterium]|nr:hypothetical protein [Candidatus Omnitrophota bacterium]
MQIHALVKSVFEIRREEWKRVILMFLYFYLTIASYYVLKAVRNAYFVDRLGADSLPWVKIVIAVLTGIFVYIYSRIANKTVLRNLINGSLLFLISNLAFFWLLFNYEANWIPFSFFIWVTLFSSVSVTQFWTFAADLFDAWEAKRVFGLVGAGGLIGGMSGSYVSAHFAKIIGTRNLLIVAGGVIFLCILIVSYLWKFELKKMTSTNGRQTHSDKMATAQERFKEGPIALIRRSRYLFYLLMLVAVTKFATELTEWQLNKMAEIHVTTGMDDLTAFFGQVFAYMNTISLVVQILGTTVFLRFIGGAATLFLLPGGLLLGTGLLFFFPAVWSVSVLKIIDGSLRYSIYQSAKEFVYLPIQKVVRYKIKPFIDMFVYQFSKGMAAFFVILINGFIFNYMVKYFPGEETKVLMVSVIVFLSLLIWFFIVVMLKREYPMAIREFLNLEGEFRSLEHKEEMLDRMVQARSAYGALQTDRAALRKLVIGEVMVYQRLIEENKLRYEGVVPNEELHQKTNDALFTKLEESLYRTFALLSMLFDAPDVTMICDNYLRGDEYVRANALELLDMHLDQELKTTLHTILDGELAIANFTAEAVD